MLTGIAAGTAIAATGLTRNALATSPPVPPVDTTPAELARDESFWRGIASHYERTDGILNLEHGYWGKMARPVQTAYHDALRMVNTQYSFYARRSPCSSRDLRLRGTAGDSGSGRFSRDGRTRVCVTCAASGPTRGSI